MSVVTLAHLMRDALDRQGILRQDLADHLQISPVSVTKWLRDDRREPIPWRHWLGICAYLHIPWATWIRVAKQEVPHNVELFHRYVKPSGR